MKFQFNVVIFTPSNDFCIQPPIQWVPGGFSPWGEGCEDGNSPPSSAKVKNA
jgi:hypothetical protein